MARKYLKVSRVSAVSRLSRLVAAQMCPVVSPVRAEISREPEVPSRFLRLPRLLERTAQAEVGVVVHGCALDDGRELLAGVRVAPRVEVRTAERLADRGLVRL